MKYLLLKVSTHPYTREMCQLILIMILPSDIQS